MQQNSTTFTSAGLIDAHRAAAIHDDQARTLAVALIDGADHAEGVA
jgi:hypothetical protein